MRGEQVRTACLPGSGSGSDRAPEPPRDVFCLLRRKGRAPAGVARPSELGTGLGPRLRGCPEGLWWWRRTHAPADRGRRVHRFAFSWPAQTSQQSKSFVYSEKGSARLFKDPFLFGAITPSCHLRQSGKAISAPTTTLQPRTACQARGAQVFLFCCPRPPRRLLKA